MGWRMMTKVIQQGLHKTYKEAQTIHDCVWLQPYLRLGWFFFGLLGLGGGGRGKKFHLIPSKLIQLTEARINNWNVDGHSYQCPLPDWGNFVKLTCLTPSWSDCKIQAKFAFNKNFQALVFGILNGTLIEPLKKQTKWNRP